MYSGSQSFHPNDFSKTVLSWTFATLSAPLEIAMRQAPLPKREQSIARYYSNFIALILEEARAIIASGLEQVDQYMAQSSKKGKKTSHLSDAKPFKLILKKHAHYPKNESNPLSMTFRGAIPDKIEHGKSMNVLLLKTKEITPEKQFIALATENQDGTELFVKIVMASSDYEAYDVCFEKDWEWQAHYLGSVVSEQRMYDVCLEATDIPCVQQIARGQIFVPNVTRASICSADISHLNLSQQESLFAFFNAREGSTLLLQGPPGTGKTTTLVSLLKQVVLKGKRTMVCAHSNKGVQVLALRSIDDMPDVAMIIVGVESKLPEKLKPMFLNRWVDIIQSKISTYHDEIELFSQGKFNDVQTPVASIISTIADNITYVQKTLNKFALIDSRQLSSEDRQDLFTLSNDPVSASDFQSFQSHMDSLRQQPQGKKQWSALLGVLNRLIDKWTRISKEAVESHLLDHASIVFSTLISAGRKNMASMMPIDFLLVDEAAQSVEAATLIPMRFQPDKVLLVGDTKQLPATVISRALDDSDGRPSKNYKWSMMWRLIEETNQPNLMLTIQYRMHPNICQWPSGQYYADRLITSPDILPMPLLSNTNITSRSYAIYQVSGQTESHDGSHSICNPQEAQYVIQIIEHIRRQNKTQSIGVITPYAAQKRLISDGLSKKRHLQALVDVNTVDGFQGDERDIIIISFTRTHVSEFLKEFRRLNVAITRPKACLIILGAPTLLSNDIGQLMADARLRKVLYSEQDLKNILTSGIVPAVAQQANATTNLRDFAWNGSAHHQFHYAQTFSASDWTKYFLWARRSAENNHPEAQYHLSQIYLSGNSLIKKDSQLGLLWLDKAAQNNFPLAQFFLGKNFILGEIIVKNVNAGLTYCNQAVANGVFEANLFLAECYEEGVGVMKDSNTAQQYYEACLTYYPKAKSRLARLLLQREDCAAHEARAISLLEFYFLNPQPEVVSFIKSIDTLSLSANYFFGTLFQAGKNVNKDNLLAMKFFKKSADAGHAESQYQFALMSYSASLPDAYLYFKKAALQNHVLAKHQCIDYQIKFNCDLPVCLIFCENLFDQNNAQIQFLLARLLDTGIAGEKNKARALEYYFSLAANGNRLANYYCGIILEEGVGGVAQDLVEARHYYELCIDQCFEAQLRLACLLLTVGLKGDQAEAIQLLQRYYEFYKEQPVVTSNTLEQCLESLILASPVKNVAYHIPVINTSSADANYYLGRIFQEGKGVKVDFQRALQHYQLSSADNADSCYRMGYMHEAGLGVAKNWQTAKAFYQNAADRNHELAAKRLTWRYSMFAWGSVPDDATLRNTESSQCVIA